MNNNREAPRIHNVTDTTPEIFALINAHNGHQPSGTTVYCYWDKGIEAMPPMLRSIYNHNLNMSNLYGFNICLLTDNNINEYTYLPPKFNSLAPNFKSDIIRFFVLHKYGGIWLDTDVIITKDMNILYNSFIHSGKDVILDVEFGSKLGCASIVMRSRTDCSRFAVKYIMNQLAKPLLKWEDIGPHNVESMYKTYPQKMIINGNNKVMNGCNFITWKENPGINKDKWYLHNEVAAHTTAQKLLNNNDCYYVITWTIYRQHNSSNINRLVFEDKRSIFHHITTGAIERGVALKDKSVT